MVDDKIKLIKRYYKLIKRKKVDTYLILAGVLGVIIGLIFDVLLIKQIFAWLILFGTCVKLYDFTEEIERNIIPYDFNNLLPPPKKRK